MVTGHDRKYAVSLSLSPNIVVQSWPWKWTCEFHTIKMDVLIFIGTKEKQWVVIHLSWAESVPGADTHIRMSLQYGNSVVSQCIVYKWIEKFKNGCTNVKNEEGAGPATERSIVRVTCFSAQNILFWGQKEDCVTMDQEHQKARGLHWKMM